MNYNSMIFRKDMTGVDEYVKWSGTFLQIIVEICE